MINTDNLRAFILITFDSFIKSSTKYASSRPNIKHFSTRFQNIRKQFQDMSVQIRRRNDDIEVDLLRLVLVWFGVEFKFIVIFIRIWAPELSSVDFHH